MNVISGFISMPKSGSKFELVLKRITDILIAGSVLLILLPVLIITALLICLDSPGQALFTQKRVGLKGELFNIYKFRTMKTGTPDLATDIMIKQASPITRIGKFLRKTSLDEIPQLLNILKGEMSIVGPRPALYNQYSLISKRAELGILNVLPGITGYAQVNGRDEISDDLKIQYDQWYVDNWSYILDWKIILNTFKAVFTSKGVY